MNKHKIFSVFTLSITLGNLWSQQVIPDWKFGICIWST